MLDRTDMRNRCSFHLVGCIISAKHGCSYQSGLRGPDLDIFSKVLQILCNAKTTCSSDQWPHCLCVWVSGVNHFDINHKIFVHMTSLIMSTAWGSLTGSQQLKLQTGNECFCSLLPFFHRQDNIWGTLASWCWWVPASAGLFHLN